MSWDWDWGSWIVVALLLGLVIVAFFSPLDLTQVSVRYGFADR